MQRPRRAPAARSARISGLLRRRPHLQEPGEGEIQQAQGQTEAQKETLTPDRSAGCRTARRRKTELEIEKATASDLTTVLGWLEREHAEDGDGFWCNRAIIERSLELEDLWVVRKGGEAVAFQVGIYAADIVSVRKDWRRKGLGDALFAASLERARIDGINVLDRMFAAQFLDVLAAARLRALRRHARVCEGDRPARAHANLRRSAGAAVGRGRDQLYPERATYGREETPPIAAHQVRGGRLDDGTIMLERRVVGLRR
jgi:GNAT superfamily N-acetyltransferase